MRREIYLPKRLTVRQNVMDDLACFSIRSVRASERERCGEEGMKKKHHKRQKKNHKNK